MDEFCFVFSTILAIGLVVRDRDWERFMGRKVAKNLIVCLFVLDEAVYKYKIKTIKTKFKKKVLWLEGGSFWLESCKQSQFFYQLFVCICLKLIVCLYTFYIGCLFVHVCQNLLSTFPPSKVGLRLEDV